MAHPTGQGGKDYPDFNVTQLGEKNASLQDMTELAVRMGAASTFDREGSILWIEQFTYGTRGWRQTVNGGYKDPTLVAGFAPGTPYCILLEVAAGEVNYEFTRKYLPLPYVANTGMEWQFTSYDGMDTFICGMEYYDGAEAYWYRIKFDEPNHKIYIYDSDGSWQELLGVTYVATSYNIFQVAKFVIDPSTHKYVRLGFNADDYDLSDYQGQKLANTTEEWIALRFRADGRAGSTTKVYIGNVVVTTNEVGIPTQ